MLTSSGSPKDYQTWLWIGTAITDSSAGSDTLKVLINRWPPADAAAPKEFNLKPAVRKGRALPHSRRQSRDFFTPSQPKSSSGATSILSAIALGIGTPLIFPLLLSRFTQATARVPRATSLAGCPFNLRKLKS